MIRNVLHPNHQLSLYSLSRYIGYLSSYTLHRVSNTARIVIWRSPQQTKYTQCATNLILLSHSLMILVVNISKKKFTNGLSHENEMSTQIFWQMRHNRNKLQMNHKIDACMHEIYPFFLLPRFHVTKICCFTCKTVYLCNTQTFNQCLCHSVTLMSVT